MNDDISADSHTPGAAPATGARTYSPDELDNLASSLGGFNVFATKAFAAISNALEGHKIAVDLPDEGAWLIEGTLSEVSGDQVYSWGPAAMTEPSPVRAQGHEVLAIEATVKARLRGTVTGMDADTRIDGVRQWIVDTQADLYVGGVICLDPDTQEVVGVSVAIDEDLQWWWDLSDTGIHQLTSWGTFVAFAPPWAKARGGTGSPEAVS